MSLTLHYHPLSSFCQKVLIGLYEADLTFKKQIVDLADERQRAELLKLWAIGKFPVLRDDARDRTVPESTIILEYLAEHYSTPGRFVPRDPERARQCRLRDRFFDNYVNLPVGKIVTDTFRPDGRHDPFGVEQAGAQLATAYAIAEAELRDGEWAAGSEFTMADCAAAPALFYAQQVLPFEPSQRRLAAYYQRLAARPSFARVLAEAKPYWALFPSAKLELPEARPAR